MEHVLTASRAVGEVPVTVVELHGEVDFEGVEPLRDCLVRSVEQDTDVVVDLADVTFIDCASLGALVEASRAADRRGHSVCLAAPRPAVRRTLAAAMLDSSFALYPDRRHAISRLSAGLGAQP